MPRQWYAMTEQEILEHFQTDLKNGLSDQEVNRRLSKFGANQMTKPFKVSLPHFILKQLININILILLAITAILIILLEYAGAIALLFITATVAIINGTQEYRAAGYLKELREKTLPTAMVIRNGRERIVPAVTLVPGDIVLLAKGDVVPADLRLLQADKLEIDESLLFGEMLPAAKIKEELPDEELALLDTCNMAYMETIIVKGKGSGVVVYTGRETAINYRNAAGHAVRFGGSDGREQIPVQRGLEKFCKGLSGFCLFICLLVLITLMSKGTAVFEICLAVLSLTAAAVPLGFSPIISVLLAAGAWRISKSGALINKPAALGILGCAEVICLNNMGILTKNELTVRKVMVGGQISQVTGDGYDPKGTFAGIGEKQNLEFSLLLKVAALCNNAVLKRGEITVPGLFRGLHESRSGGKWSVNGEAIEGALLVMAAKAGFWREKLELQEERIAELSFDHARKCMAVVYRELSGSAVAYVKGAPEVLLERCSHSYINGKLTPLSDRQKKEIMACNDLLAQEALRVLAYAYKQIPAGTAEISAGVVEEHLVFLGLTGIGDQIKNTAPRALTVCRKAGIKIMLLSGDQLFTAQAQAKKIGIITKEEDILTGHDLEHMPHERLMSRLEQVSVCARVTPQQKLRVIKALKQSGRIVAVTGDGLEDALAVREADIGIAMQQNSAGITKKVADMFLAEDHINSIVSAVEEGRRIHNKIRTTIQFLLTCSAGGIFTVLFAMLVGLPLPLTPVHILWISVLSNYLPAMTLRAEANDGKLMAAPPCRLGESVFDKKLLWRVITAGAAISACTVTAFVAGLSWGDTLPAQTMAFNTLVFSQLFFALTCHDETNAGLSGGTFTGRRLTISAAAIFCALQLAVNCLPFAQEYFHIVRLSGGQWASVLLISAVPALLVTLLRLLNIIMYTFPDSLATKHQNG